MDIWVVSIFLAIINNAVMNIHVQICAWMYGFESLGNVRGSASAGSLPNFRMNYQTVFCRHRTILHSHQQCVRVSISPHPRQHRLLSVFMAAPVVHFYLLKRESSVSIRTTSSCRLEFPCLRSQELIVLVSSQILAGRHWQLETGYDGSSHNVGISKHKSRAPFTSLDSQLLNIYHHTSNSIHLLSTPSLSSACKSTLLPTHALVQLKS